MPETFDAAFSYSVLQHFSKENVLLVLNEVRRVLRDDGVSLVQMPNRFGLRQWYASLRQRIEGGGDFAVRWWTPRELLRVFGTHIGPSRLSVDGYFSLNPQRSDLDLLLFRHRLVVYGSDWLKKLASSVYPLALVADSVYVESKKVRGVASGQI